MASVVLLRGMNVGGHRSFRPTVLCAQLRRLDVVNIDGFGLLHAAAETNRPEIVAWLAGRGLALEARTARDLTPLHIACGLGHVDAARGLIAAGADVSAPSPLGTPRQIAEKEGHPTVAALFG